MNRKMYWGIASLILIIGVVGVYFMLQPKPDTEPEKKFIVPSEADLEQAKDVNQQQRPVSKAVKPPPPGASPNGHWHGDEWHDESHQTPIVVAEEPVAVDVSSQDTNVYVDTWSDKEFRKRWREGRTKEELADYRRIELEKFPKLIESFKKSIAKSEQLQQPFLEKAKKYPLREYEKEYVEKLQSRIDDLKAEVARYQRVLEVVYGVK